MCVFLLLCLFIRFRSEGVLGSLTSRVVSGSKFDEFSIFGRVIFQNLVIPMFDRKTRRKPKKKVTFTERKLLAETILFSNCNTKRRNLRGFKFQPITCTTNN